MAPIIKEKRLLVGMLLILVGIALVLDKMHFIFLPGWVISWPMLLLVIGVFSMLTNDRPVPGIFLILIGGFFLAQRVFHDFGYYFFNFWPVIFIVAGIFIILSLASGHKPGRHRDHRKGIMGRSEMGRSEEKFDTTSGEDYIDEVAIFGGGHKKIMTDNFKGGKMTAIFGGAELDLTDAELSEGVNVLEVVAMFGGWELHLPAHWNVEIKVTPVFGGFDDKRRMMTGDPVDNTRKLIIKGVVIFGGAEINNHIVKNRPR